VLRYFTKNWLSARISSSDEARTPIPLGSPVPTRCRRKRHCYLRRPRFRGLISLPVGVNAARFLRQTITLALLGFILPGVLTSRAFDLTAAANPSRACVNPAAAPPTFTALMESTAFGLLSGTSEEAPFWVLLPVLQSFKELGKLANLFRGCRPLEVFVLIPTVTRRVSDRL
jgi:hypothetical protein